MGKDRCYTACYKVLVTKRTSMYGVFSINYSNVGNILQKALLPDILIALIILFFTKIGLLTLNYKDNSLNRKVSHGISIHFLERYSWIGSRGTL